MDKYLLAILGLIIFSIIVILYIRISKKIRELKSGEVKLSQNIDSINYDKVSDQNYSVNLKADDFTLLE